MRIPTKVTIFCIGSILLLSLTSCQDKEPSILAEITVDAGDFLRDQTAVLIPLEEIEYSEDKFYYIRPVKAKSKTYCQIFDNKIFVILPERLNPGEKAIYHLFQTTIPPKSSIDFEKTDSTLQITFDGQPVLDYFYTTKYPAGNIDSVYKRSGFIHPLRSPKGNILTRIQPPDHYHHYGIWNPWAKTLFEGRPVDFWNLYKNQGTVSHKSFGHIYSGPVAAEFSAYLDHVDKNGSNGGKTALIECLSVKVWNIDSGESGIRVIDYQSDFKCASESPLLLQQEGYGGFGFRARESWTKDNCRVLTSEGKTRDQANGTRGKWCIVGGETETGTSGILFMGHPENHEFPEPFRIWPSTENKNRGDLFFNFCPVKENDWLLEPENNYQLKYRMLVFEGKLDSETAEQYWQDFANPPMVKIRYYNN